MVIKKYRPAFTIVELLVVIVVIGVLAAITTVSYTGITQKATVASLISDLDNASKLLKMDQVINSAYPATLAEANDNKGIRSSQGNNLYYQNNNTQPQSFCVTARNGNLIYKITNNSTPIAGGCLTDGVVSDGLVLNLDAGNQSSYSGSGTTWLDLSDNINHVSLSNGPIYDVANSGSLVFDGSDDYADTYVPGLTTTATIEIWAKITPSYSGKMFFGWQSYDIFCAGGGIGYNTGNSDLYGISSATVSSLNAVNNWKQYIFEMRSDISYINNKIYINSALQTSTQLLSIENPGSRNFNGGNGRIATWRNSGYNMPMNVGLFRIYNRVLSAAEILQNFNALRGRYGL